MNEKNDGGRNEHNRRHEGNHNDAKKSVFVDIETTGIRISMLSFIVVRDNSRETTVSFEQLIPENNDNGLTMTLNESLICLFHAFAGCQTFVSENACSDKIMLNVSTFGLNVDPSRLLSLRFIDIVKTSRQYLKPETEPLTIEKIYKFVFGVNMQQPKSRIERLNQIAKIYFELTDLQMIK